MMRKLVYSAALATFAFSSLAAAEEQWSGAANEGDASSSYSLTVYDAARDGEDGYVIAQRPGVSACFVPLRINAKTDAEIVFIGIDDQSDREIDGARFKDCWNAGWVNHAKLSFVLHPNDETLEVYEDGKKIETVSVTSGEGKKQGN